MRISESHYSNLERLPERAETDSFNRDSMDMFRRENFIRMWGLPVCTQGLHVYTWGLPEKGKDAC